MVIRFTSDAIRDRSGVCSFGLITLTASPCTPSRLTVSTISIWSVTVFDFGWRKMTSTSWSWAAFLAPASQMDQNSAVQLVTTATFGLSPPGPPEVPDLLHAGTATTAAAAARRVRVRAHVRMTEPAFGWGEERFPVVPHNLHGSPPRASGPSPERER